MWTVSVDQKETKRIRQSRGVVLAVFLSSMLTLCACGGKQEAIPTLLEPVEISLSGKEVKRGDICDVEVYNARVKSASESYAFKESCQVEEICVDYGEYVEAGQVLAVMQNEAGEKGKEKLACEIDWLKTQNDYLTKLDEIDYDMEKLAYDLKMGSNREMSAETIEKEKERLVLLKEEHLYKASLRQVTIEEKEALLLAQGSADAENTLVAKENGYVTYKKSFASDNPTWQVEADEIVVMTSDCKELYVAAEVIETKAKQASEIYVDIDGEKYPLSYWPYSDNQKKLAARDELTLEAKFLPEKMQSMEALYGKSGVLYLISNQAKDVLSVSPDCLFYENGEYFVYLIKEGQKIRQSVQPGIFTENAIEIKEGLKEGDMVYYPLSDMPSSNAKSVILEKEDFEIVNKYDQVKIEYTSSVNVVTKPSYATLTELCVENGDTVKEGEVIAYLFAGEGESSRLTYDLACQKLKNAYDYERGIQEKEAEKLSEKLAKMEKDELEETYAYKVTLKEYTKLMLQMELDTCEYEYEKQQCLFALEEEEGTGGRIEVTAQCDGRIAELTSASEGESIQAGTKLCRIMKPDSALIMVYAENAVFPVGGEVTIDIYQSDNDWKGKVVYCSQDVIKAIYGDGEVLKADTAQSRYVTYVKPEEGTDYSELKYYGINMTSWKVKDAVLISPKTLYSEQDRKFVWLKKDGQMVKQYVTVGYHDVDKVWIVQGISEGDELITGN